MKRELKKIILLFSLLGFGFSVLGQSAALGTKDPQTVPPPPNAASLGKYGDIPVGLASGVPSINVPIYEVKSGKLSVPVSLSYHAGGIKVDETASSTGLGWSLNAGGVITRTVVGKDDFSGYYASVPPVATSIDWTSNYPFLASPLGNSIDTQPDVFFFNFNGRSGKFVFGENHQPILITNENLTISYIGNQFTIVDEVGNRYVFSDVEMLTYGTYSLSQIVSTNSIASSWYLSAIYSYNGYDKISFTYTEDIQPTYEYSYSFSQAVGGDIAFPPPGADASPAPVDFQNTGVVMSSMGYRQYVQKHLSTIVCEHGTVQFTLAGGRLDNGQNRLDSIKIFNAGASSPWKAFKLQYDYFVSTATFNPYMAWQLQGQASHRLRLIGLYETEAGSIIPSNQYQFNYSSTALPPVNSFAQDLWGYYNGRDNNQSLLREQDNYIYYSMIYNVGNANRTTDTAAVKAGMLTKIIYPTNGFTEFTYESNSFQYLSGSSVPVTPINLTAIGDNPGETRPELVEQTFTVDPAINSAVIATVTISQYNYPNVTDRPYVKITQVSDGTVVFQENANANGTLSIGGSQAVNLVAGQQYKVSAYAQGSSSVSAQITINYNILVPTYTQYGGGVRIKTMRNYDGIQSNYKKFEYGVGRILNENILSNNYEKRLRFGYSAPDDGILCAYLTSPPRMNFTSESSFPLESFQGNYVMYYNVDQYLGGSSAALNSGKISSSFGFVADSGLPVLPGYFWSVYEVSNEWQCGKLLAETYYKQDPTTLQYSLVKEVDYSYQTVTGTTGRGQIVGLNYIVEGCFADQDIDTFYYFDYPINSGRYFLTQKTEKLYTDQGVVSTTTSYAHNSPRYLVTTETFTDSNNNSVVTNYKYPDDYTTLPVYSQMVAKNIITPVIDKSVSRGTAEVSHTISNYAITNDLLEESTVQQSFGGAAPSTELTIDQYDAFGNIAQYTDRAGVPVSFIWGYKEKLPVAKLVGITQAQITALGSTSLSKTIIDWPSSDQQLRDELNKLRTYFPGGNITSYSYAPLIGITSQVDANGRVIFYNYDGFGRLSSVKDNDGNIVKTLDYNYQIK